jgi:hypothetical protein
MTAGLIALSLWLGLHPAAAESAWHPETGYRWRELTVPPEGPPGFTRLPPEATGIRFTNTLDEHALAANRVLGDGCGVAIGDVDGDGLPDVFLPALNGDCRLYRNLGGMKFQDVTAQSGIVCSNKICRGAVFADVNGDGSLDLLISTTGDGVLCFTNRGNGVFVECTAYAGTRSPYNAQTLTLADIDGRGPLDLYVADYRVHDSRDSAEFDDISMLHENGAEVVAPSQSDRFIYTNGVISEYGEPDFLYLNDGQGRFSPVSWTNGAFLDEQGRALTAAPKDWGLTAAFRDVTGGGAPDLYVCNDYWSPDRFWLNDGHGHFRAAPPLSVRHTSRNSMGVDFADIDRSGHVDIFVVDMLNRDWAQRKRTLLATGYPLAAPGASADRVQIPANTLLRNRGDGTFEDIANYAGVAASDWSWQPVFLDVDLDGYEDILIPAGYFAGMNDLDIMERNARLHGAGQSAPAAAGTAGQPAPLTAQERKTEELLEADRMYEPLPSPVVAFRNLGNSKFAESGAAWGLDDRALHNGIAVGDLDNDGGLDFIVNNLNGPPSVYHNRGAAPRVAVRLQGLAPNTRGIGAKIKLLDGAVPRQSQEVVCGGQYLSGSDPERVFAAGHSQAMTLEVTWRNGRQSVIRGVQPNRLYEVAESAATAPPPAPPAPAPAPFFKDVSSLLNHQHHQEFFNDYERQPLLPWQLSQEGPGVAWVDLFDDGHEELVIGSGRGGALGVFRYDGQGGMKRFPAASKLPEDLTGIVGWVAGPRQRALVLGRSNYTSGRNCPAASIAGFAPAPWTQALPETAASTGPLAVADVYGDGTLALFVGGRVIPGRYPEAADSKLYRNRDGRLELDEANSRVLAKVGLVNGAVWSDLDGDGFPELILACEWGPIRVFKNEAGQLREITTELGLDQYVGWWHGVTTGDLEGDGRFDIIAGNFGLNGDYQASSNHPAKLIYGDFTSRGAEDLVEATFDPLRQTDVPRRLRAFLANAYPPLLEKFPTHRAYSEATLSELLAALPKPEGEVQATTLASLLFLNRGHRFEAVELPPEAQLAPAFAVNVADLDGDGREDVFLSQNFFPLAPLAPGANDSGRRLDAGRGLWLRGTGGGKLEAVPGQSSGLLMYGQQRGAALCDFDGDGRVDLAVAQNGDETKLFQNVSGKPGLRVKLAGPPGNPDGIGAVARLFFGEHPGPAREIHGGSGYWSQDSAILVLACPTDPDKIWIRWPGGKTTTSAIPTGAKEIVVDLEGKVTLNR